MSLLVIDDDKDQLELIGDATHVFERCFSNHLVRMGMSVNAYFYER